MSTDAAVSDAFDRLVDKILDETRAVIAARTARRGIAHGIVTAAAVVLGHVPPAAWVAVLALGWLFNAAMEARIYRRSVRDFRDAAARPL